MPEGVLTFRLRLTIDRDESPMLYERLSRVPEHKVRAHVLVMLNQLAMLEKMEGSIASNPVTMAGQESKVLDSERLDPPPSSHTPAKTVVEPEPVVHHDPLEGLGSQLGAGELMAFIGRP